MEQLLQLYARPYDALHPVICFDERPCFLIGDLVEPQALQAGVIRKEHYAYAKLGSCALLAAIEPLTGQRYAHVYAQRTKQEFTDFCQLLVAAYPAARKLHLVLDNLNTHNASAFYESLVAEEALTLANRFEFHYTPKSASWLNCWRSRRKAPLKSNSPLWPVFVSTVAFLPCKSWNRKSWPSSTNVIKSASRFTGNSPSMPPAVS